MGWKLAPEGVGPFGPFVSNLNISYS
ncbi:hypothetical protein ARTHRO9AX_10261 [Arthrobacter sp. 9AX]|nr:hypothetical protein ARTHRO9AX_10261 [Arthrobacter sp. 9AX]